jgi:predicted peptidase
MPFFILAIFLAFATGPLFAAPMLYPEGEEPLELPIHTPLSKPLPRSAYNQEDKKAGATSLYLTLMREDGRNIWAPFQLAASSAEQGQTELAERYLQLSAKRGLWYYYNLLEDNAFSSIQQSDTYRSILATTKARYQQHAAKFEGKPHYAVPNGDPPAGGWPTIVYLHPYGKAATIIPEDRLLFAEAGVAYIEINGTQMLAEGSFRWSNYSSTSTQNAIQRTLENLAPKLKLNLQQVYLTARGQGALHAANLMANYPQFYAGAMLIAPKGRLPAAKHSLAENKRIMIAYYDRQNFNDRALALNFADLFRGKNQVEIANFAEGEDNIGGWQTRYNRPLRWVMGREQDASPGA